MIDKFNQSGQVVVVLLLTMLVGLSVGLIITQRTVTDVTTSTQTEQVSRAFSAAEAGIEKAISQQAGQDFNLTNDSSAIVSVNIDPTSGGKALELPDGIKKDKIATFWLVNPDSFNYSLPAKEYSASTVNLYFGDLTDLPAVRVKLVYWDGNAYKSTDKFIDFNTARLTSNVNGFDSCDIPLPSAILTTSSVGSTPDRSFKCRETIDLNALMGSSSYTPIMLRVRLLYSSRAAVALQPVGASLPSQAKIYNSTGFSGQSQKTISVMVSKKNVLSFLDYVVFSKSELSK